MTVVIQEVPVIDEVLWNAWLLRHKVREEKNARLAKVFGGIVVALAAIGTGIWGLSS